MNTPDAVEIDRAAIMKTTTEVLSAANASDALFRRSFHPGTLIAVAVALFVATNGRISGHASQTASRATPLDAKTAIFDACQKHRIVGIGDAHGDRQGGAFQLALIRDPRFPSVINDIVMEFGSSRYQDLADRFIRGEDVPREALQRIWIDTTQQQVASLEIPELFIAVRELNAKLPSDRRVRVLLAEPPIDWERMKTADDVKNWEMEPTNDRDWFGADLVHREVLARNRRALLLYGAAHLFRKVVSQSVVTLLERQHTNAFTVWTNAATELANLQPDVATWPIPSVTMIRGTVLGETPLTTYLGPNAGGVSPQWLAPMQDQFDAVLYLGPLSTITLERPRPWRCAEPALAERLRRAGLQRPGMAERIKAQCLPDKGV